MKYNLLSISVRSDDVKTECFDLRNLQNHPFFIGFVKMIQIFFFVRITLI